MIIPFNKPYISGKEILYMEESLLSGRHSGNNLFTNKVKDFMKQKYGLEGVYLTPSCTAALEMGALLAHIKPGDEVILPSFTFSSTANAVLIFGAVPVFCEVSPTNMNMDISRIEELITPKTKMIIPVDYAGVPCEIDEIMNLAKQYNLIVMQDCAQSYGSLYKGEVTGKKAHLACYSFHDTKNFSCGEGGALVVNVPEWRERAGFIQEKGTDRSKVIKGIQDKYSWIEKGSSYLLSDILAAMLLAQLESENKIHSQRELITNIYLEILKPYEAMGEIRLCQYTENIKTNFHSFWLIFNSIGKREEFSELLEERSVAAHTSYIPLHSSQMGRQLGYEAKDLALTEDLACKIIRLPLYVDLAENDLEYCGKMLQEVMQLLFCSRMKK